MNYTSIKQSDDERIRKSLLVQYKGFKSTDYYDDGIMFGDVVNWFEKQGDKDEEILILKDQIESLHAAIKAIKETHKIELEKQGEQKPAEWSDKDETGWTNTMIMIKECAANHYTKGSIDFVINWLKSLKNRCLTQPKQEWSEKTP